MERTIIVQTSCEFAMAVCSKMSGSRTTGVMLAGGMSMFMAPAFVAPGVPRQAQVSTAAQTFQTAQAAQAMRSEPTLGSAVAGAAVAGAAMAGAGARGARRAKGRTVVAARPDMEQWQGLSKLTALAQELLQRPSPQQLQRLVLELGSFAAAELQRAQSATAPAARAKAFAEVAQGAEQALRSGVEGQLRWAASAAAAMLLSNVVTLQPAQAADVVNYSDFLESVNRGDVEMVRVQQDMVSAQYTTKDGSRREVNLIPNAQIEDQLFNQLADKKASLGHACQETCSLGSVFVIHVGRGFHADPRLYSAFAKRSVVKEPLFGVGRHGHQLKRDFGQPGSGPR